MDSATPEAASGLPRSRSHPFRVQLLLVGVVVLVGWLGLCALFALLSLTREHPGEHHSPYQSGRLPWTNSFIFRGGTRTWARVTLRTSFT